MHRLKAVQSREHSPDVFLPSLPAGFHSPMTLTLLQGIVTIACLHAMRARGWIDFPIFNWSTAAQVSPISFLFIANVVLNLTSLGRINVPMFTALRRLTIWLVMAGEYSLLGIVPSKRILATVCVMTLGAGIAAWKDLSFDPTAYAFIVLTNLATSMHTVFISKVKKDTGLGIWPMLYYNHVITLPALFVLAWATGDLGQALTFPHWSNMGFQVSFQASVFLAFALNLSSFYCTMLNSARTQTVMGQLKNFLAFLLGLVLFDDYKFQPLNFFGLAVGFVGTAWYTVVTAQEKEEKNKSGRGSSAGKAQLSAAAVAAALRAAGPTSSTARHSGSFGATTTARPYVNLQGAGDGIDPEAGDVVGDMKKISVESLSSPKSPLARVRTTSASSARA